MSVWDTYQNRIEFSGATKRERARQREIAHLNRKLRDNLSYKEVKINGENRSVIITNTDDYSIKAIMSMPDEKLSHGGIVDWEDNKWLITSVNADNELYESGKITQCNYLLKWLNDKGEIVERWCVVEDGTKYLIGEKTKDVMAIGDARIAVTIGKDEETDKLSRGKRFLIDDLDEDQPLAYQITKPNKLYNLYSGKGVFRFILNEVNMTQYDNVKLRIADYFNWQKDTSTDADHVDLDKSLDDIKSDGNNPPDHEKKGWI